MPELVITTARRSPAEVAYDAFHDTAAAVRCQAQFAPVLLDAIAKAAGLEVTVRERAEAA